MAQVINTNSLSLITQNNINKNQSAMSTAIERLSSGLRINSAKDDAAGQAIANRFTSNIKGLTQAARNANDGISAAQTTEGALSEINNNLQRVRELTVQATTGTNSETDLDSIQDEIKSRLDEIDRVSGQTQFNGVNVLSKDGSMKIQVGANDGEIITIDLKEITSDTLGLKGFNVNGKGEVANTAATADDLTLSGFTKASSANADDSTTYSKDVENSPATAADVLSSIKDKSTLTFTGAGNGLGVAATGGTYTYDAASKSYSFGATGVSSSEALNKLAPNAGDSFTAKVTIGIGTDAKSQEVNIAKDGSITSIDGKALFLDEKGNLTQTGSGTTIAATWDKLIANTDTTTKDSNGFAKYTAVATKIEVGDTTINSVGGNANALKTQEFSSSYASNFADDKIAFLADVANAGKSDADAEAAAKLSATIKAQAAADALIAADTTTVTVTGAKISASEMAGNIGTGNFSVTDGTGAGAGIYAVTGGSVTFDKDGAGTTYTAAAAYTDNDGILTTTDKETVQYFAQANGAVTNGTGSAIYKTEAGKLTTESTTKSESTADPLKALTDAISQIDKFRSSLGAVQNRLDSAVTNLNNTTTNLSAAQSRIQDADYATEVSNMSKAQIIQQAGNSVLAKANQVPQQVLSLLQG